MIDRPLPSTHRIRSRDRPAHVLRIFVEAQVGSRGADQLEDGVQPVDDDQVADAPLAAAAKKRQEIMDKAVKAGVAKPPKQPLARELSTATNVVSRDREALARLLTSF